MAIFVENHILHKKKAIYLPKSGQNFHINWPLIQGNKNKARQSASPIVLSLLEFGKHER